MNPAAEQIRVCYILRSTEMTLRTAKKGLHSVYKHALSEMHSNNLLTVRASCFSFLLTVSTWLRSQWHWVTYTRKASSIEIWNLRTSCSTTMVQKRNGKRNGFKFSICLWDAGKLKYKVVPELGIWSQVHVHMYLVSPQHLDLCHFHVWPSSPRLTSFPLQSNLRSVVGFAEQSHVLSLFPLRTCEADRLWPMQRVHPRRNSHPHLLWHHWIHVCHPIVHILQMKFQCCRHWCHMCDCLHCEVSAVSSRPFLFLLLQGSRDPDEERT